MQNTFSGLIATSFPLQVAQSYLELSGYVSCILQYFKMQHSQMGRPAAPGIEVCGNCRVLLKPYIRTMYVYPFPEGGPSFSHIYFFAFRTNYTVNTVS